MYIHRCTCKNVNVHTHIKYILVYAYIKNLQRLATLKTINSYRKFRDTNPGSKKDYTLIKTLHKKA